MKTFRNICALALALGLAMPATATIVPGGKKAATDCFEQFDVEGGTLGAKPRTVECTDGDPSCDSDTTTGTCTFSVSLCVNEAVSGCTFPTGGLGTPKIKGKAKNRVQPPASLTTAGCGAPGSITVKLKKKAKKAVAPIAAVVASVDSKKLKDKDNLKLICKKSGSTTTTTLPGCQPSTLPVECPANTAGGPDEIVLATADENTDLDNGWTGVAHNFPVDPRASLKLCLSGCDASTNPICDASGATGTGTLNGETFGPPLPLVANLVPVCVVNNYAPGNVTAKVNIQTGEVTSTDPLAVNLLSATHFTSPDSVCPSCTGANANTYGDSGTCDSGKNQGQSCTIESILDVVQPGNTKTYKLSSKCPPAPGDFAGGINIALRLTTGTSTLTGSKPCTQQPGEPAGVTVKDDACSGGTCTAACSGNACVRRNANNECIDSKGGISQVCCSNNSAVPCFPTSAGSGGKIERTGTAAPTKDANDAVWPNGVYPKFGCDAALVTTFCEGATGTGTINGSTGLPGPGALILPGTQTLLKQ